MIQMLLYCYLLLVNLFARRCARAKFIWTGTVGQKEFYTQIAGVSEPLENAFGQNFKEELLETALQSELTEIACACQEPLWMGLSERRA